MELIFFFAMLCGQGSTLLNDRIELVSLSMGSLPFSRDRLFPTCAIIDT